MANTKVTKSSKMAPTKSFVKNANKLAPKNMMAKKPKAGKKGAVKFSPSKFETARKEAFGIV